MMIMVIFHVFPFQQRSSHWSLTCSPLRLMPSWWFNAIYGLLFYSDRLDGNICCFHSTLPCCRWILPFVVLQLRLWTLTWIYFVLFQHRSSTEAWKLFWRSAWDFWRHSPEETSSFRWGCSRDWTSFWRSKSSNPRSLSPWRRWESKYRL